MTAKKILLDLLKKDSLSFKGKDNLFSFISSTYSLSLVEIKKAYNFLVSDGQILEVSPNNIIAVPSHGYHKGVFMGSTRGYGFCRLPDAEKDDIFLPANMCGNAIDGDKVIKEEGYLDSGNVLYDTITKKPIVLVTYDVFHKFYEDVSLMSLITKDVSSCSIKNGHYIKINSVGKGTIILIFTVDQLKVEGDERMYKNVALGVSFSGFEKSFGKNVLLHCDFS